jgi:type IV secretory pathway VirB2 component (pilin)
MKYLIKFLVVIIFVIIATITARFCPSWELTIGWIGGGFSLMAAQYIDDYLK